jgi:hypothetical protein
VQMTAVRTASWRIQAFHQVYRRAHDSVVPPHQ